MSAHSVEGHVGLLPDTQLAHHDQEAELQPPSQPAGVPVQVCTHESRSLSPVAKRNRSEGRAPADVSAGGMVELDLEADAGLQWAARASATVVLQDDLTSTADVPVVGAATVVDVSGSTLGVETDVTGVSDETLAEPDRATALECADEKCAVALSASAQETSHCAQPLQSTPYAEREDAPTQPFQLGSGTAATHSALQSADEEVVAPSPSALTDRLAHESQTEVMNGSGVAARHSDTVDTERASQFQADGRGSRDTETETAADMPKATETPLSIPEESESGSLRSSRPSEAATPPPSQAAVDEHPRGTGKHLTFAGDVAPQLLS
ncbi:hypothetical protein GH5_03407 [Leishmania sp. Ghana 2012 LV757]|uniref:hypothetical protein n=1 Tax=Leishmania sp. Ghana 2012 LV757 TaxID=2803181 RepID=UPI001B4DE614|nr:hypothetical protein GH5_03407 [Leishmania sp. Ghana 2012 LV757]